MKTKLFTSFHGAYNNSEPIDDKINIWLKQEIIKVIDIKYNIALCESGEMHGALVLYE